MSGTLEAITNFPDAARSRIGEAWVAAPAAVVVGAEVGLTAIHDVNPTLVHDAQVTLFAAASLDLGLTLLARKMRIEHLPVTRTAIKVVSALGGAGVNLLSQGRLGGDELADPSMTAPSLASTVVMAGVGLVGATLGSSTGRAVKIKPSKKSNR